MFGVWTAHGSNRSQGVRAQRGRAHGGRGLLLRIRRRHGANAAGLLMFVAGFIVAPCLHTSNHRDDHEHAADGSVVAHAGEVHGSAPASGGLDHPGDAADAVSANRRHTHGQGSLAHFGVALTTPALFVVPPAPTSFEELARPNPTCDPVVRPWQHAIRSRGPPTRSAAPTSDTFRTV